MSTDTINFSAIDWSDAIDPNCTLDEMRASIERKLLARTAAAIAMLLVEEGREDLMPSMLDKAREAIRPIVDKQFAAIASDLATKDAA